MEELLLNFAQESLSIKTILFNLLVGGVLGVVLHYHFKRFSLAFTAKKELGRILPFLVLIVCLIISIVKSSLALSLGLVGALSIVRFRTAIKEPEELVYLFMAIAVGLGLGANQTALTVVATLFILVFMTLLRFKHIRDKSKTLFLTVSSPNALDKQAISGAIKTHGAAANLKKIVQGDDRHSLIYNVRLTNESDLYELIDEVKRIATGAEVSFIDQSDVMSA
ncbi:MAG: DUF4956 domain-containing protein [Patescibacteria group bacterium]|nr:DUF4956 domain-containing protein [Patescibacteria group bacterium]